MKLWSCKRTERLFVDAADQTLASEQQEQFDTHIAQCTRCANAWTAYKQVIARTKTLGHTRLSDLGRARLRKALQNEVAEKRRYVQEPATGRLKQPMIAFMAASVCMLVIGLSFGTTSKQEQQASKQDLQRQLAELYLKQKLASRAANQAPQSVHATNANSLEQLRLLRSRQPIAVGQFQRYQLQPALKQAFAEDAFRSVKWVGPETAILDSTLDVPQNHQQRPTLRLISEQRLGR